MSWWQGRSTPREVLESPSLGILKTHLDAILHNFLYVILLGRRVELGDNQRSLPTSAILWFLYSPLISPQREKSLFVLCLCPPSNHSALLFFLLLLSRRFFPTPFSRVFLHQWFDSSSSLSVSPLSCLYFFLWSFFSPLHPSPDQTQSAESS